MKKFFSKTFSGSSETKVEKPVVGGYRLLLKVNGQTFEKTGNDASIFEGIELHKITSKAVVRLEQGDKVFESIMPSLILKRILANRGAREIQFKKLTMLVK